MSISAIFNRDRRTHAQTVRERHAAQDAAQFARDVADVMALPAGRRLLMQIMQRGGIYRMRGENDDLAYVAGRRDAALQLVASVNRHADGQALLAMQEATELATRRESEIRNAEEQDRKEKRHA